MRLAFLLITVVLIIGCTVSPGAQQDASRSTEANDQGVSGTGLRTLSHKVEHLREVRIFLDQLDDYRDSMREALELHDVGKFEEARRAAQCADFFFPDDHAAAWLAAALEQGEAISEGDFITFINRSDEHVRTMTLRYKDHQIVAKEMKPGEVRQVFAEELPKGAIRLKIDIDKESDHGYQLGGRLFLSARFIGSEYGFTPIVVHNENGGAAFE